MVTPRSLLLPVLLASALMACAGPSAGRPVEPVPEAGVDGGTDPDAGPSQEEPAPAEDADAGTPPEPQPQQPDRSQPPWSQTPTPPIEPGQVQKDVVAGGRHWRIGTENGVVHVWRPAGYRWETAGTVVYLHGYYINADQAWLDHRLAEQFRDSKQNALFIVPEAPSWRGEDVFWKDLGELLHRVSRVTRLRIPDGPVVAVAHSGAYRTVQAWLPYERLDLLVMLDAMYGSPAPYQEWLTEGPRARAKRLIMVGIETEGRSKELLRKHPQAARRKDLPKRPSQFRLLERQARVVYLRSDRYDHFEIITKGEVMPLVLHLAPLKRL